MSAFPNLLRPGRIGRMELRNRFVMSPIETMYGTPDGLPSERTRDYFAARAKGGVGLITVGATGIDHLHPETPGGLHLGTDQAVSAHRALVDACTPPTATCSSVLSLPRNATGAPTACCRRLHRTGAHPQSHRRWRSPACSI